MEKSANAITVNMGSLNFRSAKQGRVVSLWMPYSPIWGMKCRSVDTYMLLNAVYKLLVTGVDVAWRSTVRDTSRVPRHWSHQDRPLCCYCSRLKAILWHPVPPGSDTFSAGERGHRSVCSQHLRMQTSLDNGGPVLVHLELC